MTTKVISATDHTPNPHTAVSVVKQLAQECVNTQEELASSQALLTEVRCMRLMTGICDKFIFLIGTKGERMFCCHGDIATPALDCVQGN